MPDKAIRPGETLKLTVVERQRVGALVNHINYNLNSRFDPQNPDVIHVTLNGASWFLMGKALSKAELAEIKKIFNEAGWDVVKGGDRDGHFLNFSSKEFPPPEPNW